MASNIPLGTYVSDGLRSGPFYTGQLPSSLVGNDNGVITSGSRDIYGPGVLYSPQNTYNICPAASPIGGGLIVGVSISNVVAVTTAANVTGAGYLTLFGDNFVTKLYNGVVYLDVPRVITVSIAGANLQAATRVTIFGFDWYGMPMQHTYSVQNIATYPVVNGIGTLAQALSVPSSKAFFRITGVYINQALSAGATISLGASSIFGLPYLVNNMGDITSIGWKDQTNLLADAEDAALVPSGCFVKGDVTPIATATTGDVRGLYCPSYYDGTNNVLAPIVLGSRLRFTCYVQGADTWLNQLANMQELQRQNNLPVIGVAQAPLTSADLYGVNQFYTGSPS